MCTESMCVQWVLIWVNHVSTIKVHNDIISVLMLSTLLTHPSSLVINQPQGHYITTPNAYMHCTFNAVRIFKVVHFHVGWDTTSYNKALIKANGMLMTDVSRELLCDHLAHTREHAHTAVAPYSTLWGYERGGMMDG